MIDIAPFPSQSFDFSHLLFSDHSLPPAPPEPLFDARSTDLMDPFTDNFDPYALPLEPTNLQRPLQSFDLSAVDTMLQPTTFPSSISTSVPPYMQTSLLPSLPTVSPSVPMPINHSSNLLSPLSPVDSISSIVPVSCTPPITSLAPITSVSPVTSVSPITPVFPVTPDAPVSPVSSHSAASHTQSQKRKPPRQTITNPSQPLSLIDKAAERRRKNRESSSRCYYNRKRIIDNLDRQISAEKTKLASLYDLALELRHENARLKKSVVTVGISLPTNVRSSSSSAMQQECTTPQFTDLINLLQPPSLH